VFSVDGGFYVFLAMFGLVLVLFLLSVFGPTDRKQGFWAAVQRFRHWLDLASYWLFNIAALLTITAVAVYFLRRAAVWLLS